MPQHAADYIKILIQQRKGMDTAFSVQRMCDDLNLPKSTIDKFLSKQTTDTSWSNVASCVTYLGGSLDELAGIQTRAITEQVTEAVEQTSTKTIRAEYPALALLVESYEKEIHRTTEQHALEMQRITSQHEDYLNRFRRLIDNDRQALVEQHASSLSLVRESCNQLLDEKEKHRHSFEKGRNAWRSTALVAAGILLAAVIWGVWELSNLPLGLTGYLLRQAGLISAAGGLI